MTIKSFVIIFILIITGILCLGISPLFILNSRSDYSMYIALFCICLIPLSPIISSTITHILYVRKNKKTMEKETKIITAQKLLYIMFTFIFIIMIIFSLLTSYATRPRSSFLSLLTVYFMFANQAYAFYFCHQICKHIISKTHSKYKTIKPYFIFIVGTFLYIFYAFLIYFVFKEIDSGRDFLTKSYFDFVAETINAYFEKFKWSDLFILFIFFHGLYIACIASFYIFLIRYIGLANFWTKPFLK